MASPEPKKREMTPRLSQPKTQFPPISPSPLRPISLQASLSTHGNDSIPISTPQRDEVRTPLSPADCRTLKKLLLDVQSPSPSSPSVDSLFEGEDAYVDGKDGSSESGEEGEALEGIKELRDEMEGGYEDEDKSMELSGEDDESDRKNGDDIEDVMNLPGKVAPPAQPLDLNGVYVHERATPGDMKEAHVRHAEIEKQLAEERVEQERSDLGTSPTTNCWHEHESAPVLFSDLNLSPPNIVQTPGGKHVEFAPNASIPETPFTKTLNYFKQYKGKENLSSKSDHDNSLPRKITEVAHEFEDGDLEQYRNMDLTPLDMVMGTDVAGDLIMASPLTKTQNHERILSKTEWPDTSPRQVSPPPLTRAGAPFHGWDSEALNCYFLQTAVASPSDKILGSSLNEIADLDIDEDENSDTVAKAEDLDAASNPDQKQMILYPQHPTFVTVIGMLPATMFWVTLVPIAKYSSKAFDIIVEKMTGLKM